LANKKAKKRKSPQFVVEIKVVGQYLRKNWAILCNKKAKKRKSPQFVVPKKEVGQYLRKNGSIFAIHSSGKIFLTPKMVHRPKIFWRRGGGWGGEVAGINLFRKNYFRKWSGKWSRFLII
jgi:hypothetical protein